MDLEKSQLEAFVSELTELTMKHKVKIGGCGCCGSPYLKPTISLGVYRIIIEVEPDGSLDVYNLEFMESEDHNVH